MDTYTVVFQMDKRTERLAQVLITSGDEFSNDTPNTAAFDRLEALLSEKYSSPQSKRNDNLTEGDIRREATWVFSTTSAMRSFSFGT